MLTFHFVNNMASPPIGTYDYSPDKKRLIPEDRHISRIGFRTVLMSDQHTRLNGMTLFDGDDKIVEIQSSAMQLFQKDEILLTPMEHIVSVHV